MKINAVDFNDTWVAKFESAEAFADAPQNAHLFPELKHIEQRKEQLKAVWNIIVKPVQAISHDNEPNDDKPKKTKRAPRDPAGFGGNKAGDGAVERAADGEGEGQPGPTNHLRGEDELLGEDNGEEGEKQPD